MKFLHWIIFSLGCWFVLAPFVGDDILALFATQELSSEQIHLVVRWDDFLLGLMVMVLALIVVTAEQANHKHPGLRAMHFLQIIFGGLIAVIPFATPIDENLYLFSHVTFGALIAVFALLQIWFERPSKN